MYVYSPMHKNISMYVLGKMIEFTLNRPQSLQLMISHVPRWKGIYVPIPYIVYICINTL